MGKRATILEQRDKLVASLKDPSRLLKRGGGMSLELPPMGPPAPALDLGAQQCVVLLQLTK